jgi:HEAT repeat protein
MMENPVEIPFEQVVEALLDTETTLNPRYLYRLSDLEETELKLLRSAWPQLPLWRRQALMQDIEDLGADDYLLNFISLGRLAIEDEDPDVRLLAVRTLWEYEYSELIPLFIMLEREDQDSAVRHAAVSGLGRFVYAGEVEEIPSARLKVIEDALVEIFEREEEARIRQAALESLGFSSRVEVEGFIRKSFKSPDKNWKASALIAMGRSANQVWIPEVTTMLESNIPLLRSEAARAAGNLEIQSAVPTLLEMLEDPDDNTRTASIWALSQIGGEGVRDALEGLYDESADDEDQLDFLESALENLSFTEGAKFMPLFDFPAETENEEEDDWYEELEEEELDDLFDDEEDTSD